MATPKKAASASTMISNHFNILFISLLNKYPVSFEKKIRERTFEQFTFNEMKDCLSDGDSIPEWDSSIAHLKVRFSGK